MGAALLCVWYTPALDPRLQSIVEDKLQAVAAANSGPQYPTGEFECPMDRDVRSRGVGYCPRCGMRLVERLRDPVEYPVHLTVSPNGPRASDVARLQFGVMDPATQKPLRDFLIVHEKLYHTFVISQDLQFFVHDHPQRQANEDFHLDVRLPKPGMYRVLSDFYPKGGTPQLVAGTVIVPGGDLSLAPARIASDLSPQQGANARVEIEIGEVTPGQKIPVSFHVTPADGFEPYLGAMAHMLFASADLVDMIHTHPLESSAPDGRLQFRLLFPRAGMYRIWVQFQRKGVVNTVAFNIPAGH